jgi:hypothetical protein
LATVAGLEVERERRFTPFVRVFVYCHVPGTQQVAAPGTSSASDQEVR